MDKISDSIVQKTQIISSLGRETILSLRLAAKKYKDENYAESGELLERYLEKFPSNVSAQILLSKTYAMLGKYHQAVQHLKSACETIHSSSTFNFYLKEIEVIQRGEKVGFTEISSKPIELKIPYETTEVNLNQTNEAKTYEHSLVSETLARIYISQGEFTEAIGIYEKLIERKPEHKEKYLHSIEELKSRLEE